ncbi:protein YtsP [Flavobacteriaceae bacterium UJ101]|nr:protein YtsP [Flavobacteriaceae bacterium UJ101]
MDFIQQEIRTIIQSNSSLNAKLLQICEFLDKSFEYYNWTGFYFKNGDKNELKLGPYVGAHTDHVIIPFGKGICGQVALSNETFLVDDVYEQENYLACSIDTKSEIVVPIFKNGENVGQIDIDSHTVNAFSDKDQQLLEFICTEIGKLLEKS